MSKARPVSLSEVLRRAIGQSGLTFQALAEASGVERGSISRFVRGERSLRLDKADRLAAYLGLELRPQRMER
jgi:plasmid maintenance system antidote protein VapI